MRYDLGFIVSVDDVDKIFAVNFRGIFLCASTLRLPYHLRRDLLTLCASTSLGAGYQYAAKQMIKQGRGGKIIGASSRAGKRGRSGASTYSATKFAVRGFTQAVGASRPFLFSPDLGLSEIGLLERSRGAWTTRDSSQCLRTCEYSLF